LNPATFNWSACTKTGNLSGHVFVCLGYRFCLFLRFFYWILEMFGSVVFLFFFFIYSDINGNFWEKDKGEWMSFMYSFIKVLNVLYHHLHQKLNFICWRFCILMQTLDNYCGSGLFPLVVSSFNYYGVQESIPWYLNLKYLLLHDFLI